MIVRWNQVEGQEAKQLASELWEVCETAYEFGSPWSIQQFEEDLQQKNSHYFLIQSDEHHILGFLSVQVMLDEAEILNFVLLPFLQGTGKSSELFEELSSFLQQQNIQQLFLEVRQSNQQAYSFYRKKGFLEISVRKNYYHHPRENGLVMMLKVGSEYNDNR